MMNEEELKKILKEHRNKLNELEKSLKQTTKLVLVLNEVIKPIKAEKLDEIIKKTDNLSMIFERVEKKIDLLSKTFKVGIENFEDENDFSYIG